MSDTTPSTSPVTPAPAAPDLAAALAALTAKLDKLPVAEPPKPAPQPVVKRTPAAPPARPVAGQTREQQLQEFANQKAREVETLRLANEFGLKEEELEGDFASPTEMRLYAQNVKQSKDLATLSQSVQALTAQYAAQQARAAEPEDLPDTGGPSGTRRDVVQERYTESAKLGRTQEARWLRLRAIYSDPNKRLQATPTED